MIGVTLLLACVVTLSSASAESVQFLGFNFPVESTSPVAGGQLKVVVSGKPHLFLQEEAPRRVASLYFSSPDLFPKIVGPDFTQFVIKAVKNGQEQAARDAVAAMLQSTTVELAQVEEFLSALAKSDGTATFYEVTLIGYQGTPARHEPLCLAYSFLRDTSRRLVRERAAVLIYRFQIPCGEFLKKQAGSYLEKGDMQNGLRCLDTISQIFADGSAQFIPFVATRNRLQKMNEAFVSGDYLSLQRIVRSLGDDPILRSYGTKLSTEVVHQAAEQAFRDRKPGNALRLLSALDFAHRSPKDHELVAAALEAVSVQDRDALVAPEVTTMLRSFAFKDDTLRGSYASTLHKIVKQLLESGSFQLANPLFDQLLAIRPDPSPDNDALRVSYARRLISVGAIGSAKEKVYDIQTGVPFSLHLRLLLAGGYADMSVLLCLLLAIVLASVTLLWGRKGQLRFLRRARVDSGAFEDDDPTVPRRFVVYSHGVKVAQAVDDYAECLSVFSLNPGVTLQQIKVAYRNAVKTCHPDLNPNAGPEEAARFISMTKTYERLLVLHAHRTGER